MEMAIASYIAQGYVLSNRWSTGATMFKKKEFSILWLVVGLILCVFPLLIYLMVYASQSDKMIQIQLVPAAGDAQLPATSAPYGTRSDDGQWWWDGASWQPMTLPASSDPSALPPSTSQP
jgi:hypothetical protein